MKNIITIDSLTKDYDELRAVDNISFSVKEGSFFAFLGPNGAGKSTTINILCTLLPATKGTIIVDGHKIGEQDVKVREKIGTVFQGGVLDSLLTVRENLEIRGSFYGLTGKELGKRIDEAADVTAIHSFIKRRYGKLSGGQKRRADIARALLHTPKILFLDEPTTGLDPQTRKSVWNSVKTLQEEKKVTVFLTTHYMEEAAAADDVAIIDSGKIAVQGSPSDLRIKYSTDYLKVLPKDMGNYQKYLKGKGLKFENDRGILNVVVDGSHEALSILKDSEKQVSSFEVVRGNMDDVFINITGHRIEEEE